MDTCDAPAITWCRPIGCCVGKSAGFGPDCHGYEAGGLDHLLASGRGHPIHEAADDGVFCIGRRVEVKVTDQRVAASGYRKPVRSHCGGAASAERQHFRGAAAAEG